MSPKKLLITSGVGPLEVRQFVAELAVHLASSCEALGLAPVAVSTRGPEAAPRCVTLHLPGDHPGLAALTGTHALLARAPGRARKRWFAAVSLLDEAGAAEAVVLDPRDVRVTACRAGGPGGQHVNKTSSAVRVEHLPSGLSVRVADERSQRQNVRLALERLGAMLAAERRERADAARASERLRHYRVERGRPAHVYDRDPKRGGLRSCEPTCSR